MSDPNLKYSNYFAETPPPIKRANPDGTRSIERATWILFALCFIPFLGAFFATATIVLGIILITRDRLKQGLIAVIAAPIACAMMSMLAFILFIAIAGSAAAYTVEQASKNLPKLEPAPRTR